MVRCSRDPPSLWARKNPDFAEDAVGGLGCGSEDGAFAHGIQQAQFFADGKIGKFPPVGGLAFEDALEVRIHLRDPRGYFTAFFAGAFFAR